MPAVPPLIPAGSMSGTEQPVLAGTLVLRPWRHEDAPDLAAAYADPAIRHWNLECLDEPAAAGWIAECARNWSAETGASWAVTDPGGALRGRVTVRGISLADGLGEVTYWVLAGARGSGVATAAVGAVSEWAFGLGLHRLQLRHSVRNPASCRVAAKTGYALEGVLRSALRHADGWHDMHLHARLAA
ncbi:MAG: acetyltransferase [Actinomycetia bacterium]|nr:acetyltransferase [Actinomycetes bacterium]